MANDTKDISNLLNQKFSELGESLEKNLEKKLGERLDKKIDEAFESRFILLFNQGFEEVVMPQILELDEKIESGVKSLKKDINEIKVVQGEHGTRLDRIESKLDKVTEKQLDHENRIQKLEKKRVTLA